MVDHGGAQEFQTPIQALFLEEESIKACMKTGNIFLGGWKAGELELRPLHKTASNTYPSLICSLKDLCPLAQGTAIKVDNYLGLE